MRLMLEVTRQGIKGEDDYQKAMEKIKPGQGIGLLLTRGGSRFFVPLAE
jgi:hypothetical protein